MGLWILTSLAKLWDLLWCACPYAAGVTYSQSEFLKCECGVCSQKIKTVFLRKSRLQSMLGFEASVSSVCKLATRSIIRQAPDWPEQQRACFDDKSRKVQAPPREKARAESACSELHSPCASTAQITGYPCLKHFLQSISFNELWLLSNIDHIFHLNLLQIPNQINKHLQKMAGGGGQVYFLFRNLFLYFEFLLGADHTEEFGYPNFFW